MIASHQEQRRLGTFRTGPVAVGDHLSATVLSANTPLGAATMFAGRRSEAIGDLMR
jgi:hypothetical protein